MKTNNIRVVDLKEKFDPWQIELDTFYLFPETGVLVAHDNIEDFISLYENIEDEEYYEVKLAVVKKHKLSVKF